MAKSYIVTGFDDRPVEDYDYLNGPDGFECVLTEPEDRTWGRDGRPVVDRLNEQHATTAASAASYADASAKALATCADIVRKYMPTPTFITKENP